MMKGWKELNLESLGFVGRGKSRHRPRNADFLYGKAYPFVQTADVKAANYKITSYSQMYSEEGLKQSKLWPINTLCITIAANIADSALLGIEACFPDSVIGFIPDDDKADVRFAKYLFDLLQVKIKQISQGAAQDNLSMAKLRTIKFLVPPLKTQRKIATILSTYNNLIENNLKRIKLLEKQAQHLFQKTYAKCNTEDSSIKTNLGSVIDYNIGGGWGAEEKDTIFSESAYVIRGTDMPKTLKGNFNNVPSRWHKKSNLKSRKLEDRDIIFEVSGGSTVASVGRNILILDELLQNFDSPVMCASFCKLVRANDKKISLFLASFLNYLHRVGATEIYEKRAASNIVNYNWVAFLKYQEIIMPSVNSLIEFNSIMHPIYSSIYKLGTQNQHLKEARDILLPRLMMGMIDVDSLEVGDCLDIDAKK